ncbi:MAG: HAD hydrolase family protein, partial [Pseudoflavonifractor sp.]
MKRDYKALLVDVDGTLVCPERKTVNERTAAALTALQARGILVAVATGRTPRAVRPEILGGFRPDYYICMNGTYVTDRNARTIYHHPMSQRQLDDICRLAVREDCPVGFAFSDGYYCYYKDEVYRPFYEKTNGDMTTLIDGTDRTRHLAGLPYAAFGIIAPEHLAAFTDPGLGLHITPFSKNVYDICQAGYTKAGGAEA